MGTIRTAPLAWSIAFCLSNGMLLVLPGAAQATNVDATQAQVASTRAPVQLATVKVSADHRESDLQKTAASASVLDGEQLRKENKLTIAEIVSGEPGVQVQDGAEGPTFIVRGVSNNLAPNTDSPNAIYVDGIYTDRGDISRAAFYDLDRVEILRGPQGTLFGANAVGGAINILSHDPVLGETSGLVKVGLGNYGDRRSEGVLNLPINQDMALRAAFATERRDGYMSTGQEDVDIASARIKLAYKPSDVFSMLVGAQVNRLGGKGPGAAYSPYPQSPDDLENPWYSALPANSVKHVRTTLLHADLRWTFEQFELIYQPTWYKDHFDADSSYSGDRQIQQYNKRQTTQEIRLQSRDASPLQWVTGLHYLDSNAPQSILVMSQPVNAWTYTRYQRSRSWAAFGQATLAVMDDLRLTAGVRYSHDRRSIEVIDVPYDSTQASTIQNYGTPFATTFTKTTWKVGVEKDLGASSMLYANVSTGFRAGGFYANEPFAPETVTAYTVGSKNRFLDNRLQVNAEAFLNKFDGYQLSYFDPATFLSGVFTARDVQMRGMEVETNWLVGAQDKLDFSLSYLHSEVGAQVDVPDTLTLVAGQPLNHSPRWSGNLGYEHVWDLANGGALTARAKIHSQSGYWAYYSRADGAWQQAYHQSEAYLTYDSPGGRWSLTGYVTNIENVPVITVFSPAAGGIVQLGAPRMYGVQLTWTF
jgi:iron complex outermembrane receptor protein